MLAELGPGSAHSKNKTSSLAALGLSFLASKMGGSMCLLVA